MSYPLWKAQVAEWREKYNVPRTAEIGRRSGDPTAVRILAASCAKCGSKQRVHRHHKGHEYLFACLAPDIYAARYIEFRTEDIVALCRKHHLYIHKKYEESISIMHLYPLTPKRLEETRLKLVAICNKWLAKPYMGRKK